MDKIVFKNFPDTTTPVSAENLNQMQSNIENAIPEIIDNLTTEDATKVLSAKQGKVLNDKIEGSEWQNLPLYNNWTSLGGNYQVAQYKKIGNHVFLRGLVKNTIGDSNAIAVLPEGFRPQKYTYFSLNMNDTFLSAYTEPNGTLIIANYTTGNWIDLSGASFFID